MDTESNVISWNWNQLEIISDSLAFVVANVTQITLHFTASVSSRAWFSDAAERAVYAHGQREIRRRFFTQPCRCAVLTGIWGTRSCSVRKKPPLIHGAHLKDANWMKGRVNAVWHGSLSRQKHTQTHTLQNNRRCSAESLFVNSRSEACNDPFECSKV